MKRYIPLLALLLASLLYSQSKMDINNLIDRGGLKYAPNDDEPYKGKVFDFYENGQKKLDGNYRKGLMNGKWTYWYANESKKKEGMYKDGLIDGLWTYWDNGGNKYQRIVVRKGEKDGEFLFSYSNHHMKMSAHGTFKNGIENGTWTWWYENGH